MFQLKRKEWPDLARVLVDRVVHEQLLRDLELLCEALEAGRIRPSLVTDVRAHVAALRLSGGAAAAPPSGH
jgi:hypothetical protein